MDGGGNALSIWYEYDTSTYSIYSNRFEAGAWKTAAPIETEGTLSTQPRLAVAANGTAFAAWSGGAGTKVWANHFVGGQWSTAQAIGGNGSVDLPELAIDEAGNAVVIYQEMTGTREIWANRTVGGVWGTAERLRDTGLTNAANPKLAMAPNGTAWAVWQEFDSDADSSEIWGAKLSGGVWAPAELITKESQAFPSYDLAVDNQGNALVLWARYDGVAYRIMATRLI
jgi:hypothetical protein